MINTWKVCLASLLETAKKEREVFKLKGIAIGHISVFDTDISNICRTASAKVQSVHRIKSTFDKRTT